MMNIPQALIVDDEFLSRVVLKRLLGKMGYGVVGEAANGAEAVRLAEELQPDLILMDVAMPVMSGLDATRRITRMLSIPVVVVSGYDRPDTITQAHEAGASAYLKKPVMLGELRQVIEQVRCLDRVF